MAYKFVTIKLSFYDHPQEFENILIFGWMWHAKKKYFEQEITDRVDS